MTISLPIVTRMRPLVRLLYRRVDLRGNWTLWAPLPMAQRFDATTAINGFMVDGWSRYALPFIGEATLRYKRGVINGRTYDRFDQNGEPIPPDLRDCEIRIQVSPSPALAAMGSPFTPAWKTAWWGTVETQDDHPSEGERVFHCFDGLFRAKRWQLIHHSAYIDSHAFVHARGHPGYNVSVDGFYARKLGNLEATLTINDPLGDIATSGITNRYYSHSWPHGISGSGAPADRWTDKQAIEHALQSSRGKGDPVFEIRGETHLLDGNSVWPVVDGMRAWDMTAMIADRRRGRGLLFPDWDDDSGAPDGPLVTYLRVRSQFKADLSYTPPGSSPITITGSDTAGTSKALDLAGDQRLVPGSLKFSDRLQYRMDYVENRGEVIEVLATLDYTALSLAKRWTDADATAFQAVASARRRATARWDPVYQRHGIPTDWTMRVGDGNGAATTRCDYKCADDGTLVNLETENPVKLSSPLVVRIMNDLPLYEGYDYTTTTPARYDGATEHIAPPRRPVMGFDKKGTDLYRDLMRVGFQLQMDQQYGVLLKFGPDQDDVFAGRYFSVSGVVGFISPYQSAIMTVGLQFGNRVRMATGRPILDGDGKPVLGDDHLPTFADETSRRRLYVYHPGLSLWLAHPGAIWELDRATTTLDTAAAKRAAAGGSGVVPGILRDDRAALAQQHALTCVWYLEDHRTCSWTLMDCGFLPSFTSNDADVTYHKLGDMVTDVTHSDRGNGDGEEQTETCNTPITGIVYNNVSGETTWETDWSDLDTVQR